VRTPAFREFVRLMIPKMVTTPIEPIQFQVFNFLATRLAAGSVAALSVAKDFQGAPVNVSGVAFSLAIFPVLSAAAASGDRAAFTAVIRRNLIVVGGLSVLAAGALVVLGPRFVTLFRGGAFDDASEQRVVAALVAFAISVPFDALQYPLARALYATRNTVLQVMASLGGLVVAIGLSAGLVGTLGLVAIPIAYAAGTATKSLLMGVALVARIRRLEPAPVEPQAAG
jgi:putative peptidoglycan lipid II flippase